MGGERERERDYDYRHIDIDIEQQKQTHHFSMSNWKSKHFYIPIEFLPTLETMNQILRRERSNFSEWVRNEIEHYVMLHEPGNPQQRLDKVMELGKAYDSKKCFECEGERIVVKVWGDQLKGVLLCAKCFEKHLPRLTNWKWLKEK